MDTQRSRRLAYWLRHRPESAGLVLDPYGWADLAAVAEALGTDEAFVAALVAEDEKNRYELVSGRIRARQGHSIPVRLELTRVVDEPPFLYHGTRASLMPLIMQDGLRPMARHHVHLSSSYDEAYRVGARRNSAVVVLRVRTANLELYTSSNHVYLTDYVSPDRLEIL